MMRSLYSGVSGLKVHQTKMDVIGNNIANVNTIGFKASSVAFTDIFYQTTQTASGPNAKTGMGGQNAKQIGLGSTLGAISTNITGQGGSQRTDNALDLMISGDGFFVVNKGGANYFTKAGNFTVDAAGTLVNGSGYPVMGWQSDEDGNIVKDRVSAIKIMTAENMTTDPAVTTKSTIFGNINSEDDAFNATNVKDQYVPVTTQFYDALGYEYQATFHVRQTGADGEYTVDLYDITKEGNTIIQAPEDPANPVGYNYNTGFAQIKLAFNATKANVVQNPGAANERTVKPGQLLTMTQTGTANGSLEGLFKLSGITTTPAGLLGACEDINIDFSTVTNYGSDSTIDSERGIKGEGAGKAVGKMSSYGIQTDGKVVASYSNGDKKVLGQIVVATFPNAAGLEKVGENLFAETMNSGSFNGIGEDVGASGGKFNTGVVEMSNVDLSSEFTDMITTQRGFQANSRIITTSDTMLEELINLKR